MRICIIGDSHTGALKRAWDNHFNSLDKSAFDIVFFASGGLGMADLKLDGKKLLPSNDTLKEKMKFTSNGHTCINLTAYDLFLIYGLRAMPYFTGGVFYSDAVIEESIKDNYTNSLSFEVLKMIRQVVDKKIFIGHCPLLADTNRDGERLNIDLSNQYINGISLANKRLFNLLGSELLTQPTETIAANGRYTHSRFSKGSKRLDLAGIGQPHPENDNFHMNDEFGKLWLELFLKKISLSTQHSDVESVTLHGTRSRPN